MKRKIFYEIKIHGRKNLTFKNHKNVLLLQL